MTLREGDIGIMIPGEELVEIIYVSPVEDCHRFYHVRIMESGKELRSIPEYLVSALDTEEW